MVALIQQSAPQGLSPLSPSIPFDPVRHFHRFGCVGGGGGGGGGGGVTVALVYLQLRAWFFDVRVVCKAGAL